MIGRTKGERSFAVFNVCLMIVVSALFVVPFIVVASTSLVSAGEAARRGGMVIIPERVDWGAYNVLFARGSAIVRSYGITLFRTIVGTVLNLLFTATLAYALAKRTLPGRTLLTMAVFFTMLFSGGLIPTFLLVKNLGMFNSIWSLVIPSLVNAWWMFIMRNFLYTIPESLEEAATIDGASPPVVLLRIVVPVSLPAIATIGLFYAVWHWNSWFDSNIYITDIRRMPVQNILRQVLINATAGLSDDKQFTQMMEAPPPPESIKSAVIMVATIPILFVYPFVQKYFVKGVLIGSVKG